MNENETHSAPQGQNSIAGAEPGAKTNGRFAFWRRLPGWARGGAIFVAGLIIGAALAAPDQSKLDEAAAIKAKEKSIYASAYAQRDKAQANYDELTGRLDTLRSEIEDKQSAADNRERRAKRKLAKLRNQISGARRTIAKSSFGGDGMYLVGDDIEPGVYKAAPSSGCYWARLSSGDTSDIIDNNNADGPVVLTVAPGDYAVEVTRCATFHKQ